MKNNKLAKFMALVLLVTLLAVILVSGTYAKYTTAVSAKDTATVARWNITLNGEDISKGTQKTLKLGLFDTINDTDFTSEESDVTAGTIYWRWKFERNDDSADTDFGINTPEVVVTATITVEQVD